MIISREPIALHPGQYETRAVKCARCAAVMDAAPWPLEAVEPVYRPRCGRCGSMFTYPCQLQADCYQEAGSELLRLLDEFVDDGVLEHERFMVQERLRQLYECLGAAHHGAARRETDACA